MLRTRAAGTDTGSGRRIHDLRHTAACLWLARGVDLGTVQAWMGHESIATTNQYLHFLGTAAHGPAWTVSTRRGHRGGNGRGSSPNDRRRNAGSWIAPVRGDLGSAWWS